VPAAFPAGARLDIPFPFGPLQIVEVMD